VYWALFSSVNYNFSWLFYKSLFFCYSEDSKYSGTGSELLDSLFSNLPIKRDLPSQVYDGCLSDYK